MTDQNYAAWLAAFDAVLRAALHEAASLKAGMPCEGHDDQPVFDRTVCGKRTYGALNGRDWRDWRDGA